MSLRLVLASLICETFVYIEFDENIGFFVGPPFLTLYDGLLAHEITATISSILNFRC